MSVRCGCSHVGKHFEGDIGQRIIVAVQPSCPRKSSTRLVRQSGGQLAFVIGGLLIPAMLFGVARRADPLRFCDGLPVGVETCSIWLARL
jgi:hypothetical protein